MILSTRLRTWCPRALGRVAALAAALAMPLASMAAEYTPDPSWNNGLIGADNFAATDYNYRRGQKIVHLDNGDVIVAGVVPGVGTAAGHSKIGLVRYNRAGVRQTWSNPGANGFYDGQYVITPCMGGSAWCGDVKDVKGIYRFGDRVFVLADTEDFHLKPVGGNPPLLVWVANPSVDVYVFGVDGALQSSGVVDSDDYADDDSRTVLGGGIAVYDNGMIPTVTSLVYAGTGIVDGVYRPRFARFTIGSDGTFTTEVAALEPAFGSACTAGQFCQFGGIALGGRSTLTSPPRIYVAGSRWHGDPPPGTIGWEAGWDMFAASLNSSGTPRTGFGTNGIYTTEAFAASSQSAGQKIAVDPGFLTSQDEVFVLAAVDLACRNGTAILKLTQAGSAEPTFGIAGHVRYGGSDQTDAIACSNGWLLQSIRADYPTDIAYSNGKLGVSGLNIYGPGVLCPVGQTCPEDNVDGEVAVIDSNTGTIESWRGYAYADAAGGTRSRHSGFWGIVPNGDDTFSLAGDVRYFNRTSVPAEQRGKQMVATLRVAPRGDVIFKNGFDVTP